MDFVNNLLKQEIENNKTILSWEEERIMEYKTCCEMDITYAKSKFFNWFLNDIIKKNKKITDVQVEQKFKSEQFGGTIDCLCKINDKLTLLDIKTSSRIYSSHLMQLTAYKYLLKLNNINVEDAYILRIGIRGEEEYKPADFVKLSKDLENSLLIQFKHLIEIYYEKKKSDKIVRIINKIIDEANIDQNQD